jgi:hypothetical protein
MIFMIKKVIEKKNLQLFIDFLFKEFQNIKSYDILFQN